MAGIWVDLNSCVLINKNIRVNEFISMDKFTSTCFLFYSLDYTFKAHIAMTISGWAYNVPLYQITLAWRKSGKIASRMVPLKSLISSPLALVILSLYLLLSCLGKQARQSLTCETCLCVEKLKSQKQVHSGVHVLNSLLSAQMCVIFSPFPLLLLILDLLKHFEMMTLSVIWCSSRRAPKNER